MPRASKPRLPKGQKLSEDPKYEHRIQDAIEGVASGKYKNLQVASHAENVAYTTLRDRALGKHRSSQAFRVTRRLLTPEEETTIIDWATLSGESGEPWSKSDLRAMITKLTGKEVGKCYIDRFLHRHCDRLKLTKPSKLDPKRAKNFNRSNVIEHLTKWQELNERYGGIPPQNIFNLDEKGIQMGGGRKNGSRKAIFGRADKDHYKSSSDNLELSTLLECISAAGVSIPPLFVLQEGPMPDVRDVSDIAGVSQSKSGWTDSQIMADWVERVFIPFALEHCDRSKPIVLWVDGHETHETAKVIRLLFDASDKNGCLFLLACFPSKCTHKLQPLDVLVFTSIQRAWKEHADLCLSKGIKINRYTLIPEYMHIRRQLKPDLIKKAFAKTGLYPVNVNTFTNADFAPSKASSTKLHTPANYPDEIPTSPPAVSSDADDTTASEASQSHDDSDSDYNPEGDSSDECEDNTIDASEHHITRSVFAALKPMAVPACLRPDKEKSHEDLVKEVQELRRDNQRLNEISNIHTGEMKAMNAHLTILGRQMEQFRVRLDNEKKRKERGSTKIKARFMTLPENRAAFEAEEAEREKQQQVAAEKEAQKEAEAANRQRRINEAAFTQDFDQPLSSFKKKDELLSIAIALNLPTHGTVPVLNNRIKEHLQSHPDLANNRRFAGLFLRARLPRSRYPGSEATTTTQPSVTFPTL